jgi:hypothetical protein
MVTVRILYAAVLLAISSISALGQLSPEDIEALRERGEREGWTFTVRASPVTDRPLDTLCGFILPTKDESSPAPPIAPRDDLRDRTTYDWRVWNCVNPIRDQGQCGSCWAFGAIGAMESLIYINDGRGADLAEQWLVSCTGAGDCGGGNHGTALNYLKCGGSQDPCGGSGAVWETDFPYVASNASCGCPYAHPYCLNYWYYVTGTVWIQPSVAQIKQAILDHGPVAVTLYWSPPNGL